MALGHWFAIGVADSTCDFGAVGEMTTSIEPPLPEVRSRSLPLTSWPPKLIAFT